MDYRELAERTASHPYAQRMIRETVNTDQWQGLLAQTMARNRKGPRIQKDLDPSTGKMVERGSRVPHPEGGSMQRGMDWLMYRSRSPVPEEPLAEFYKSDQPDDVYDEGKREWDSDDVEKQRLARLRDAQRHWRDAPLRNPYRTKLSPSVQQELLESLAERGLLDDYGA